ncbi:MAG: DHH family phosphoesterase [bacterium]|nr:DHH family phosphoesterase [bacterium]
MKIDYTAKSKEILEALKDSKNIFLHFHVKSDPDSIGSALAMKFALESMGKNVDVIRGDSLISEGFKSFPGIEKILDQNYIELDKSKYDTFISLDSSSASMITKEFKGGSVEFFPKDLKVINIDHHPTNTNYGQINFIDEYSPATAQIIFKILKEWGTEITNNIAVNLMLGIYSDTGGFQYSLVDSETFAIGSILAGVAPDFKKYIFNMNNTNSVEEIYLVGLGLSSIELFGKGNIALVSISKEELDKKGIKDENVSAHNIIPFLRSVVGWNVSVTLIEGRDGMVKGSIRTRDEDKWDVSLVAKEFGGGGHKGASGFYLKLPLAEAKKLVVETLEKIYSF